MKKELERCAGLLLIALCSSNKSQKGNSQVPTGKEGVRSMKKRICSLLVLLALPSLQIYDTSK
jgi:hypothetical protein